VHAGKIIAIGISGCLHLQHHNDDRGLFPNRPHGAADWVVGAYLLTGLPMQVMKPAVTFYFCVVGIFGLRPCRWLVPDRIVGGRRIDRPASSGTLASPEFLTRRSDAV
jgi:hypothetical protein